MRYENRLVQIGNELESYLEKSPIKFTGRRNRTDKEFTLIFFKDPMKYSKPYKLNRQMNPGGLYISEFECNKIFAKE